MQYFGKASGDIINSKMCQWSRRTTSLDPTYFHTWLSHNSDEKRISVCTQCMSTYSGSMHILHLICIFHIPKAKFLILDQQCNFMIYREFWTCALYFLFDEFHFFLLYLPKFIQKHLTERTLVFWISDHLLLVLFVFIFSISHGSDLRDLTVSTQLLRTHNNLL